MNLLLNYQKVAEVLIEFKFSIIDSWEKKVRANIASAQHHSTPVLVDHLPSIIENLIEVFKNAGSASASKQKDISALNRTHGNQRATQTNYSLEEILKEFSLFRETIIEHLYSFVTPEQNLALIVHQFVDQCVQSTVLEFERLQSAEINQQKNDLELEKKLRQRFVAALTHDLRTPLTAALMSVEMLQRKSEPTTLQQKYLGKISHSLLRMENMIQDFLDVTLIKSGQPAPVKFSEFNLNKLIVETIEDLTTINGARFIFVPKANLNVYLSEKSMSRILENLVSNAIKYGSQTGLVTIVLDSCDEDLLLSVHNEGNPIDEADLKNLFDHFIRTESAKESGTKGWGLGLPLVKGLVTAQHGTVVITSDLENGTTFFIRLPQKIKT